MNTQPLERNKYIDIVKGVAIFLVVLGHIYVYKSGWGNYFVKFIYSFHMPLFSLISGYLLYFSLNSSKSITKIIKNKMLLLFPIIIFNFYWVIFKNIQFTNNEIYFILPIKYFFWKIFDGYWFLWGILYSSIIFLFVKYLAKDSLLVHLILLIYFAFIPSFIFGIQTFRFIFIYQFLVISYFATKYNKILKFKKTYIISIISIIFIFLLYYWDTKDYIYVSGFNIYKPLLNISCLEQIKIDSYRLLVGVSGSIFVMSFIYFLYNKLPNNIFSKIFQNLGIKSLEIYAIQEIIFTFIIYPLIDKYNIYPESSEVYLHIINFSIAIMVIVLCQIIIAIIKKSTILNKVHFGK